MEMNAGHRYRVIGPCEWLERDGCQNRFNQIGVLVTEVPADIVLIKGRGATNVFRIKFMDSLPGMFHHVPGPCLKCVEFEENE